MLLALVLGSGTPSSAQTSSAQTAGTFANPLRSSAPDPWMVTHRGRYYLTYTSDSHIEIAVASSMRDLARAPGYTVWTDATQGRCCQMWAPEIHKLRGPGGLKWYLYYTADDGQDDNHRLHVLESSTDSPLGPYRYKGVLETGGWAIDGHVFTRKADGKAFLFWSGRGVGGNTVYVAPLRSPWETVGPPVKVAEATLSWETRAAKVNEGPEVLERSGQIYLIYSANDCASDDYLLGRLSVPSGANLLDPATWKGAVKTPALTRFDAGGAYGPGHNGFFKSPDGTEDWMVYHANPRAGMRCTGERSARAQRFGWNRDGTPDLGRPAALVSELALPSGDPGPGAVPVPVLLSTGARASASSSADERYPPQAALDTDRASAWNPNAQDTRPWIGLDMGRPTGIRRLELTLSSVELLSEARRNFAVWASNDPGMKGYVVLGEQGRTPLHSGATWALELNSPKKYRYLRIVKTAKEYFSLSSLRVFGTP